MRRVAEGNLALVYGGDPAAWAPEVANEYVRLVHFMERFAIIPAGRHLWASGVKGRQYLFNCHVAGWGKKLSDHFEFTFMRLMEGGGVGANYSSRFLERYGAPRRQLRVHIVCDPSHPDYEAMVTAGLISDEYSHGWEGCFAVEDSREGWAAALVDLLDTYMTRRDVRHENRVYDVSRVRGKGAPLRTFGGYASGPQPFAKMLHTIGGVMNGSCNNQVQCGSDCRLDCHLTPVEAMEIDHAIAECVVSGGNRRSARMATCHWNDPFIDDFLACKADGSKHWTTNISVEIDDSFIDLLGLGDYCDGEVTCDEAGHFCDVAKAKRVHRKVVEGMLLNGEPGYWNSSLSNEGEVGEVVATNPCFHPDTIVETERGPMRIADMTEPMMVYTKHAWGHLTLAKASASFVTKRNAETVRVGLSNGDELIVTPDHRVMLRDGSYAEAGSLRKGQKLETLCRARRGWRYSGVKLASQHNRAYRMEHRMLWEGLNGTIPSGYDIDHVNRDHHDNRGDNLRMLTHAEHARLSREQVPNDHQVHDENGNFTHSGNGGRKMLSGAIPPPRATRWKNAPHVKYVVPGPVTDVYDITVDHTHNLIANGVVAHNCGEIALEEWENCNLGHVNLDAFAPTRKDGPHDILGLVEAHRLMTRFLIRATYGDVNDAKQAEKLAMNRRIGVGHLGVQGFWAKKGIAYSDVPNYDRAWSLLGELYGEVRKEARAYAFQLRIPEPVKVTTVAPTGTIAKLPGVTEGAHPVLYRWFERRVRFSLTNPDEATTVQEARQRGYDTEVCQYDKSGNTAIVVYPTMEKLVAEVEAMGYPAELVESADEIDVNDMLAFQAMYQTAYADNAVSYTVNIPEGKYTAAELGEAIARHLGLLKGTTVMTDGTRPQAPYTRITEAEFRAYSTTRIEDGTDEDCASGACPVR